MATAEVAARPQDNRSKRKAFGWFKRLTNRSGDKNASATPLAQIKGKKGSTLKTKNNPYPESGFVRRQHSQGSRSEGNLSYSTPASRTEGRNGDSISFASIHAHGDRHELDGKAKSNASAAPTFVTDAADTIHSDAGHSKAMTNTTGAGAMSSLTDGATGVGGEGSTFSSRNQSEQSLTTTLTTIQSQNAGQQLGPSSQPVSTQQQSPASAVPNFSHAFPHSPIPGTGIASAIPPHMQVGHPTYNQATAGNQLSDNASILTLASSSKRRRRSQDTDASVRALAPSSVFGGSRESLPISVLSGNTVDSPSTAIAPGVVFPASQSRGASIGGIAGTERGSVYSSQGVSAPALVSERNSYYAASKRQKERMAEDAKSISSTAGIYPKSEYDARSISEIRSGIDVPIHGKDLDPSVREGQSIRGYEGSVRSNALGHGRNDSIPGSIGGSLHSPMFGRQQSTSGAVSRRSSNSHTAEEKDEEDGLDGGPATNIETTQSQETDDSKAGSDTQMENYHDAVRTRV